MTIANSLYNGFVRELLPRDLQVLNGVAVKSRRFLDTTLQHQSHEESLITGIERACQVTDSVVLVGAGYGVSTVRAARVAESVDAFEAGREQYEMAVETAHLNKAKNSTVHHAIVNELRSSNSPPDGASRVSPSTLPHSDVLILDCEGAELNILRELPHNPREIVVETHGFLDSPTDTVRSELNSSGYIVGKVGDVAADEDCVVLHGVKQ